MAARLMVTGASGFVAGSVVHQAGAEWEVHALSGKTAPTRRENLRWHTLDLLDPIRLRETFEQVRPAALIHIAAIADIDFSESHPEVVNEINVRVTRELADLCRAHGTRMVFTSTDTVFDGERGNYVETDPPNPVNHYGRTKAQGERAVAERLEDYAIARLAIVMGLPFYSEGNSFLVRLRKALDAGREVPVPAEEIRTPVDVIALGRALLELAGNSFRGIIHLGGNDRMDRLTFSRLIAERLGYPPERIVAAAARDIPGRARRPRDVSLNNAKTREALNTPMRGLLDGLELVLANQPNS